MPKIANELAELLRGMQITSSIAAECDPLQMGQNGFDHIISIDPSDADWKVKLALFSFGAKPGTQMIFAPLYLPQAVSIAEHVHDDELTVLLRHVRAYDPFACGFIERFDGLFRVHNA